MVILHDISKYSVLLEREPEQMIHSVPYKLLVECHHLNLYNFGIIGEGGEEITEVYVPELVPVVLSMLSKKLFPASIHVLRVLPVCCSYVLEKKVLSWI